MIALYCHSYQFKFFSSFKFAKLECDRGYFRNSTNGVDLCIPCAVGTYSDKENAQWCRSCSPGYTTSEEGSTSSSECQIGKKI